MTTTTQITNIADKLDLNSYAGEFIDDYDMDAVRADYIDRLTAALPDGVFLYRNGDVIATLAWVDEARDFDWDEFIGDHDPAESFDRHDRTAKLLPAIADATAAIDRAERNRVTAVRVAKNSGRFSVEDIAAAAEITRDGVYKMLARSRPTVTLENAEQAQWLAELPELAGNGHHLDVDGATVELTSDALDVLADLDEHDDGHYDGTFVWFGGTEYRVEG